MRCGLEGFYDPLAFFYHVDKLILVVPHAELGSFECLQELRIRRRASRSDLVFEGSFFQRYVGRQPLDFTVVEGQGYGGE
jgi:hypothetical protein